MKVDIEIPNKDVNIKGVRTQTGQIDTYTRQEIDDRDAATLDNANEYSDEKKVEAIEAAGEYTGEVSLRLASNLLLSVNPLTYILTVTLLNEEEEELDSKSIDLPLEEMIVSIDYDEETKEIIFELKSGEVRRVPVGDIVSGLVDIDTFNNVIEDLETIINGKQDTISVTGHMSINNDVITTEANKVYPAVMKNNNISYNPTDYPNIQMGDIAIINESGKFRIWVQETQPDSSMVYWGEIEYSQQKITQSENTPPSSTYGGYDVGDIWVQKVLGPVGQSVNYNIFVLVNIATGTPPRALTWIDLTNSYSKGEIDAMLSNKQDNTTILTDTTSTTVSLTLVDNHEYRYSYTQGLANLTLTMPNGDFISSVVFVSGSTPTQMTYDSSIKWSGTDVTSNAFVPQANQEYEIVFWYNGLSVNAVVRGVA